VLCGLASLDTWGGGRRSALLESRRPPLELPLEDPFYELNGKLDARQREIDEARAQILAHVLAQETRTVKGATQSL
jgi:hypothetical protein